MITVYLQYNLFDNKAFCTARRLIHCACSLYTYSRKSCVLCLTKESKLVQFRYNMNIGN